MPKKRRAQASKNQPSFSGNSPQREPSKHVSAVADWCSIWGINVTSLISMLFFGGYSVYQFIENNDELIENSTEFFTISSLGLFALILYSWCLWIRLRRIEHVYKYTEGKRRVALIGLFAITLLMLASFLSWRHYKTPPPGQVVILVADICGHELKNRNKYRCDDEPKSYRVAERIIEQLRRETKNYSDVKIKGLGEAIPTQEGSDLARRIGKQKNASVVIWGFYAKTAETVLATVYFEIIKRPFDLELDQDYRELSEEARNLENYQIQFRLADEMSFLTLTTVGLISYEKKDYGGAISQFSSAISHAIYQKNIPENMISPALPYALRGIVYLVTGEYSKAIADYNQVVALEPNEMTSYVIRGTIHHISEKKRNVDNSKKDYSRVIADIERALKLAPNKLSAKMASKYLYKLYALQGDTYMFRGEFDQAINYYNNGIAKYEDQTYKNEFVYYQRGFTFALKGEYEKALLDYDEAVRLAPKAIDIYCERLFYSLVHQSGITTGFSSFANREIKNEDQENLLTQKIKNSPEYNLCFYEKDGDIQPKHIRKNSRP